MPGEDPAHVGALDDGGEAVLLVQLDELGRAQHRQRERWVVHREQRAVRRGCREHVGQPLQLPVGEVAVVVAGHAGVEGDDPQPVDLVHPVLGAVVVGVEEPAGVRRALVVVAHHPDHDRAHRLGGRLDQLAQAGVRRGLGPVGQVAGEDQRLRCAGPRRRAVPGRGRRPASVSTAPYCSRPPASRCGSDRCAIVCRGAGYWPSCFTPRRLALCSAGGHDPAGDLAERDPPTRRAGRGVAQRRPRRRPRGRSAPDRRP